MVNQLNLLKQADQVGNIPLGGEANGDVHLISLPLLKAAECRTDDCAELSVVGDLEIHVKMSLQAAENIAHRLHGGEVAGKDDVAQLKAAGGKNGDHGDGFRNHVGNSEGQVVAIGQVADIAEIGRGEIVLDFRKKAAVRHFTDAQVNLAQVTGFAELLDMGNVIHSQELFGQAKQGSPADTSAAEVIADAVAGSMNEGRAGAHADDDGLIKAGPSKVPLSRHKKTRVRGSSAGHRGVR